MKPLEQNSLLALLDPRLSRSAGTALATRAEQPRPSPLGSARKSKAVPAAALDPIWRHTPYWSLVVSWFALLETRFRPKSQFCGSAARASSR